jgi:ribosomal protein S18 acetylase RimI-like enzyme
MTAPVLRPMRPEDVGPATDLILRNNWGVRRDFLEFASTQPRCHPIVADADGEIVATGVGTANGPVGWVGTIFVAPERRRGGLGRAMTEAVIERLEAARCRTLLLVATGEGRRLYERMGFEVQVRYEILEAPGLPAERGPQRMDTIIREFRPEDLPGMAALDREGTGEDRRHALEAFASPSSAKVAVTHEGDLAGFIVRPPWGGGATIAPSTDVALAILDARRRAAGPERRVRAGLIGSNAAGIEALERAGFTRAWGSPRMTRGEPLTWQPDWIWGQFNFAMG